MFSFTLLLVVATCFGELPPPNTDAYTSDDINTWLGYNISDIDGPVMQSLIDDCAHQLSTTGVFAIPNWITTGLSIYLQIELLSAKRLDRHSTRTIFQDYGDFTKYDKNSVRNRMLTNHMEFIPRHNIEDVIATKMLPNTKLNKKSIYQSHIFGLYNSENVLNFFIKIIDKAFNDTKIYRSKDSDGSVYGFVGKENDWFSWHYDESIFSCVHLIKKPKIGGLFRYVDIEPPLKMTSSREENHDPKSARIEDRWKTIGKILDITDPNQKDKEKDKDKDKNSNDNDNNNDGDDDEIDVESMIHTLDVPENSIYCFFGNRTMHDITKIESQDLRAVMVFAYVNDPNWQHSTNVRSLNEWGEEGKEKKEL